MLHKNKILLASLYFLFGFVSMALVVFVAGNSHTESKCVNKIRLTKNSICTVNKTIMATKSCKAATSAHKHLYRDLVSHSKSPLVCLSYVLYYT